MWCNVEITKSTTLIRLKNAIFHPKEGTTLNCKFNKLLLVIGIVVSFRFILHIKIKNKNFKNVNNREYDELKYLWKWAGVATGETILSRLHFIFFLHFPFNIICARYFHSHSSAHYTNVNISDLQCSRLWPPKKFRQLKIFHICNANESRVGWIFGLTLNSSQSSEETTRAANVEGRKFHRIVQISFLFPD